MPKLYEIAKEYAQLEDVDDENAVAKLDEIQCALQEKATNITFVLENMRATVEAMDGAMSRMAERKRRIQAQSDRLRQYVIGCMVAAGINKIECPDFTMSVRDNPPKVVIDNEDEIPIQYCREPPTRLVPDKKKILEEIKMGVVVDGCHVEQGKTLIIK